MKILADQNISKKTTDFVQNYLKKEICRVSEVNLRNAPDEEIVKFAVKNNFVILTQDADFGQIYYFKYRRKLTILIVKSKKSNSTQINSILEKFFNDPISKKIKKSLVIIQEHKVRIIH